MQARYKHWLGRSIVRSLRPGTHFQLTESPFDWLGRADRAGASRDNRFTVMSFIGCGINNLPSELARRVDTAFGTGHAVHGQHLAPELHEQAQAHGYANHFTAIRRRVPWRPMLEDTTGLHFNPRPTAPGPQYLASTILSGARYQHVVKHNHRTQDAGITRFSERLRCCEQALIQSKPI